MTAPLEPCPFCGSVALTHPHPGVCEYVECQACNAYGPAADPDGLAWNRRIPDRAALVEVALRALTRYGRDDLLYVEIQAEQLANEYLAEQERTDEAE